MFDQVWSGYGDKIDTSKQGPKKFPEINSQLQQFQFWKVCFDDDQKEQDDCSDLADDCHHGEEMVQEGGVTVFVCQHLDFKDGESPNINDEDNAGADIDQDFVEIFIFIQRINNPKEGNDE